MIDRNNYLLTVAKDILNIPLPIILYHGVTEKGLCGCRDAECKHIGKHPVSGKPEETQILSVTELAEKLKSNISHNIAAWIKKEANIIVIDVDKKNGGLETFKMLEQKFGTLPSTLKTLSGGGGFHLFYRLPPGFDKINLHSILEEFEGIDFIRNNNIVLPGSRHYSGNYYRFDINDESINFKIADLPDVYIKLLTKNLDSKPIIRSVIPEGQRNTSLFKMAAEMYSSGFEESAVLEKISTINSTICQPPLSDKEVLAIIDSASKQKSNPFTEYSFETQGTCFNGGESPKILCNFHAKIVEQIDIVDGSNGLNDKKYKVGILSPKIENHEIIITPEELDDGSWVPKTDAALITLGTYSYRQHIRVALRALGDLNNRRKIFITLGWVTIDDKHFYLSNNGAVHEAGFTDKYSTSVEFGGPGGYQIGIVSSQEELHSAYDEVKKLLSVVKIKKEIALALFASVFRAPLIKFKTTDFCIGVFGPTGSMKSTIVGLFTSFYGPEFSFNNLPESFSSTANYIERRAYLTSSCLLVIDDWVPGESSKSKAESILRSHGNLQGRGRLNPDTSLKKTYYPRSFTIVTGEDLQVDQSLRARLLILEMQRDYVDRRLLTHLQKVAKTGIFNKFLGSYINWIIKKHDLFKDHLNKRFSALEQELLETMEHQSSHARTIPNIIHLQLGLEIFGMFCVESNLMTEDDCTQFLTESKKSLLSLIDIQNKHQESTDPVNKFLSSLMSLLEKGDVHIKHTPSLFNNQSKYLGYKHMGTYGYSPSGECIGEIIDNNLCLKKTLAFTKAKDFSYRRGEPITILERGLGERLKIKGIVVSTEEGRTATKRTLNGERERCWIIPNWKQIFLPDQLFNSGPNAPEAPVQNPYPTNLDIIIPDLKSTTIAELKHQRAEMKKEKQDGTPGNENMH